MREKIKLSGVPETMLQTVYARAKESSGRGAIHDAKAEELIEKLDYDFSLADKDTAMHSGVIARTIAGFMVSTNIVAWEKRLEITAKICCTSFAFRYMVSPSMRISTGTFCSLISLP